MSHYEFVFRPIADSSMQDQFIARLLDSGFDSFQEDGQVLTGYLSDNHYNTRLFEEIDALAGQLGYMTSLRLLEEKNWNEEWEKYYEPVLIAGKCFVRAPFHTTMPGVAFELVIEPKMAFGTAHHETTQLMAEWLLEQDVNGMTVLDVGCGTGILAILANKMGALSVIGIDNDAWAWKNALENFNLNGVVNGKVLEGDAGLIEKAGYEFILANINRNILLHDLPDYAAGLKQGGKLLMSGFYEHDKDAISEKAQENGLRLAGTKTLNQWAAMLFIKY